MSRGVPIGHEAVDESEVVSPCLKELPDGQAPMDSSEGGGDSATTEAIKENHTGENSRSEKMEIGSVNQRENSGASTTNTSATFETRQPDERLSELSNGSGEPDGTVNELKTAKRIAAKHRMVEVKDIRHKELREWAERRGLQTISVKRLQDIRRERFDDHKCKSASKRLKEKRHSKERRRWRLGTDAQKKGECQIGDE